MRSLLVCDAVVAKLCHWWEIVHDMFYFPGKVLIIMQSIDTFVIKTHNNVITTPQNYNHPNYYAKYRYFPWHVYNPPILGGFDPSFFDSSLPGIPSGFSRIVGSWSIH